MVFVQIGHIVIAGEDTDGEKIGQSRPALFDRYEQLDANGNVVSSAGARMTLKLVTDEDLVARLNTSGYDTAMLCEVTGTRSLG